MMKPVFATSPQTRNSAGFILFQISVVFRRPETMGEIETCSGLVLGGGKLGRARAMNQARTGRKVGLVEAGMLEFNVRAFEANGPGEATARERRCLLPGQVVPMDVVPHARTFMLFSCLGDP